jgi:hypothetical protein
MAVLSILASTGAGGQTAPRGRPPTGVIVGQVVDAASGRPVGGAIVGISGTVPLPDGRPGLTPSPPIRVISTAEGRFAFGGIPASNINLYASKPGYSDGAYGRRRPAGPSQQLKLADGERIEDVVIRVWKFGAISGTVVDEAGEPLVNIGVRAFSRSMTMGGGYFAVGGAALTDDRGMYRIGSLTPGEYIVGVVPRNGALPLSLGLVSEIQSYGPGSVMIPELSGLVNRPGTPYTIRIGDAAYGVGFGTPVPPPPSSSRTFVYPMAFYPAASTRSQASGIAIVSGEERSGVDLQLRPVPAVRVSGLVFGPYGPIVTGLRLVTSDPTVSDREGRFTFPAVPSGQYLLRVRAGPRPSWDARPTEATSMFWADMPLAVGGADIADVSVVLQPGFRISGRFEFEGTGERPSPQRMQQVPIAIEPATPGLRGPMSPPVRPDGEGRFTSAGLPPGRYFVRIGGSPTGWRFKSAAHEGRDVADSPIELRGDAQVVITFSDRWNNLKGTVTSARGAPDADALVLLFPTDAQMWTYAGINPRRIKSARTTRTGEYVFTSVPEGDYYVVAVPDQDARGWQDPKALEGLARGATPISIAEGETKSQALRTQEIR